MKASPPNARSPTVAEPDESMQRARAAVDSKGRVRLYVDVPAEVARRFSVLAALRGVSKRDLLAQILSDTTANVSEADVLKKLRA